MGFETGLVIRALCVSFQGSLPKNTLLFGERVGRILLLFLGVPF